MALGNHLMLAGLIFQIISLVLFTIVCIDLGIRTHKYRSLKNPTHRQLRSSSAFRGFLWAATVALLTIFTRCVYRVIELGGGWNNSLMREETPFIVLESWYSPAISLIYIVLTNTRSMISIAVFALIIFHPGVGFQNQFNTLKYELVAGAESSKEAVSLITIKQAGKLNVRLNAI
jgi:RTA1 like protein